MTWIYTRINMYGGPAPSCHVNVVFLQDWTFDLGRCDYFRAIFNGLRIKDVRDDQGGDVWYDLCVCSSWESGGEEQEKH